MHVYTFSFFNSLPPLSIFCQSVCLSVCSSVYLCLSVRLSVCVSVRLSIVCVFVCLSVCLSMCLSVCVCLSLPLFSSLQMKVLVRVVFLIRGCGVCKSVETSSNSGMYSSHQFCHTASLALATGRVCQAWSLVLKTVCDVQEVQ